MARVSGRQRRAKTDLVDDRLGTGNGREALSDQVRDLGQHVDLFDQPVLARGDASRDGSRGLDAVSLTVPAKLETERRSVARLGILGCPNVNGRALVSGT